MEAIRVKRLVVSIAIPEAVGIISSIFTITAIPDWYSGLAKPFFTPPPWLFGPAWTILYALMGIALYFIWEKYPKNKKSKNALVLFGIQLFLNFLWTVLFFGLRSPLLGAVGIVALWIAIAITIIKFYGISKKAGIVLLPYLIWVTFAMALNIGVLLLNP